MAKSMYIVSALSGYFKNETKPNNEKPLDVKMQGITKIKLTSSCVANKDHGYASRTEDLSTSKRV